MSDENNVEIKKVKVKLTAKSFKDFPSLKEAGWKVGNVMEALADGAETIGKIVPDETELTPIPEAANGGKAVDNVEETDGAEAIESNTTRFEGKLVTGIRYNVVVNGVNRTELILEDGSTQLLTDEEYAKINQ